MHGEPHSPGMKMDTSGKRKCTHDMRKGYTEPREHAENTENVQRTQRACRKHAENPESMQRTRRTCREHGECTDAFWGGPQHQATSVTLIHTLIVS